MIVIAVVVSDDVGCGCGWVDSKGLPPEYSETATTPLVYRFSNQGFWIYQEGTSLFGRDDNLLITLITANGYAERLLTG